MKLVYDMASLPVGLDPGNLTKIYEQHHLIYWDSSKGGTKPQLYAETGDKAKLLVVDLKGSSMDMDKYSKEFKDEEFWKKELHKCQNSPHYFWSHYGTAVYPHNQDDLREYLVGIGLTEIVAKDSDKAKKLWDKQKAKIKKVTDKYTIEFLKQRAGVLEVVKAEYDSDVKALEILLESHIRLFDSNKAPLPDKKRITVLSEKIARHMPVLLKYSDIYRSKKGKWDRPILHNTSYGVLLEMFYDVLESENKIVADTVDSTTNKLGRAKVDVK